MPPISGSEITLRRMLILLAGLILLIAGLRGKVGSTLGVFLTPEYIAPGGDEEGFFSG